MCGHISIYKENNMDKGQAIANAIDEFGRVGLKILQVTVDDVEQKKFIDKAIKITDIINENADRLHPRNFLPDYED